MNSHWINNFTESVSQLFDQFKSRSISLLNRRTSLVNRSISLESHQISLFNRCMSLSMS